MKILLGDFNTKVGREDIFQLTIGNKNLHEIINDNEVRVVHFSISKNLRDKSTMFTHINIRKYTCMSPDGKIHIQIGHILIDSRGHSGVLDIRSFRAANYDTNQYLVVAKALGETSSE
jgi:hypothetical protein